MTSLISIVRVNQQVMQMCSLLRVKSDCTKTGSIQLQSQQVKHYLLHSRTPLLVYTQKKKSNHAKFPDLSRKRMNWLNGKAMQNSLPPTRLSSSRINRVLFQGCGPDTSVACQPAEMCKLCKGSSAGRQWKLGAIWSEVCSTHRNLELSLMPHTSWVRLFEKIISPCAPNPRAQSGIAAVCSLFIFLCLDRLVACFPVV